MLIKKEIIINGMNLVYYEIGKGKPILFLHGGRLQAMTFYSLLCDLSAHYHVIAPDIPGYGGSSNPINVLTYNDYASFFHDFLEKLNIRNITVVGYSLGGGIAYHLASITKDIAQLILVDAAGIEKSPIQPLKRDIRRMWFYITHPVYISAFIILLREYVAFLYKHIFNLQYIKQIRKNLEDSSSYVNNILIPTHIIWAKNDDIFPVEIAYKLNRIIKKSTINIVDEGHDWPLYKGNLLKRLILRKIS